MAKYKDFQDCIKSPGKRQVQRLTIYTIGHSNQDVAAFIGLLKHNSIEVVVDVRSRPYSRYASRFNKKEIQRDIRSNDMKYIFMGKEIGGKPADQKFYDPDGYVLYSSIAESPIFIEGIDRLLIGIKQYKIALMCSEENPEYCHRRLLIGRVLSDHGVDVLHIRSDGSIQAEEAFNDAQQSFFDQDNRGDWKSAKPVLR